MVTPIEVSSQFGLLLTVALVGSNQRAPFEAESTHYIVSFHSMFHANYFPKELQTDNNWNNTVREHFDAHSANLALPT